MAPARRSGRWSLVFDDGRRVAIESRAIIGRAPDLDAHGAIQAVTVGAEQRSVSKSHALVDPAGGAPAIRDLGSVNGVVVVHPDGSETEATAEQPVSLRPGDEIELGDVVITVEVSE